MALEATQVCAGEARPGVPGKKGVVITQVEKMLAAGGEVWSGDETTLREFPPLRCAWARRGQQAIVVISGRNGRRVIHGMLNVVTGQVIEVVRERGRSADVAVALQTLGQQRPEIPKLLVWDNAPAHHTRLVDTTAKEMGIELAWLPFRSPELNPCEDLWRQLKGQVAANRVYPSMDLLADHAVAWLKDLSAEDVLRCSGLRSSKFEWLPT
jgi:transposase